MDTPASVLVVGASAAGLSTAQALRRNGYQGGITVLGAESELPYDRPPLSKQILAGTWEPERAQLRPAAHLSDLNIDFILGDPAVALDAESRTVHAESGLAVQADAIVIATGVRPRTLFGATASAGVHVLRTLEEALALRADLLTATRLVVVGEGVLGSEIAATARKLGLDVTIVGPLSAPMAGQLGPRVASLLGDLHTENGVNLRLGTGVSELVRNAGRVAGVRLDTGEELPADLVVVAVGATPATEWLDGSGLTLDNGVVCDANCRAAEGIYAVGDVARWHHDHVGALVRLENRTNATEQAAAVAANILGAEQPYTPISYFWTDQFDAKIQVHGTLPAGAEVEIVEGSTDERRFVARYRADGRVTGVVGWNMPKQTRLRRQDVVDAQSVTVPAH
ncbi:FAD-dependent oxidoreductase [Nocardia sp. NBC_00565]|uniref:NAD(P)/FAD-dependent oxidoreductase n=1 Tax=Nocardia sp. NBC_00565 TaxID=2975993 RepID=UPI002E812158|nr:FAD-dependent oxidoreductase [Nocardia sp. NBC_00565]WUC05517.1 FAD-dependent oxidoreductase [Nocardia sp. NBC_00565]